MSMQTPAADHYRTPDAYPLAIGDRVYDIQQLCDDSVDEPEAAIVVDTHNDDAYSVSFKQDGSETVLADYEPNQRYGDFDTSARVVTIAWTSSLDALAGRWREFRDDPSRLTNYLSEMKNQWDVPLRYYDYPESRLADPTGLG